MANSSKSYRAEEKQICQSDNGKHDLLTRERGGEFVQSQQYLLLERLDQVGALMICQSIEFVIDVDDRCCSKGKGIDGEEC